MGLYDRLVRIIRPLLRFFFPVRFLNCPPALSEEGLIVCANHLSDLDPLFLAVSLPRNLTFMAKEELFRAPIVGKIAEKCGVIPLSRNGGDAAKLLQAVRELKNGKVLAIFPQGTRCRRPLAREDFKGGAGMLATLSGANILPVGIYTKNYKARLFRKTTVQFGEAMSIKPPEDMGKKEQSVFVSDLIFSEIEKLEKIARECGK